MLLDDLLLCSFVARPGPYSCSSRCLPYRRVLLRIGSGRNPERSALQTKVDDAYLRNEAGRSQDPLVCLSAAVRRRGSSSLPAPRPQESERSRRILGARLRGSLRYSESLSMFTALSTPLSVPPGNGPSIW